MKWLPERSLFDDVFEGMFADPMWKRSTTEMKTDIHEKDGNYLLSMELPGFKKEDIHIELHDGYLNVSASHNENKEEKDAKGNVIRKERYSGSCARSFYIGDVREEDIKAKFENGELLVTLPSKAPAVEENKKRIMID